MYYIYRMLFNSFTIIFLLLCLLPTTIVSNSSNLFKYIIFERFEGLILSIKLLKNIYGKIDMPQICAIEQLFLFKNEK